MTDAARLQSDAPSPAPESGTDNAAHARSEARTLLNSKSTVTARLDTQTWGEVGFTDGRVAQTATQPVVGDKGKATEANPVGAVNKGSAPAEVEGKTPPDQVPEKCPGNADLQKLLDTAARNIYDPAALGDLNKVKVANACVPNSAEAVRIADDAVKAANDPYTDVLPEQEAKELKAAMEGRMSGVGVQIGRPESAPGKEPLKEGPIQVQRTFPNSPAEAAGIKKGDLITHVNGTEVSKMTVDDVAVKLLRGPEGTDVKISIVRDGKPQEIDLKRAEYNFPSVSDQRIGDYAYIHFEDMGQEDSAEELFEALQKNQDAKGIILDLRDNPGGLLPNALMAASMIMEKGEVLKVRSRVESDPSKPEYEVQRFSLTQDSFRATGDDPEDIIGEEDRFPDLVHQPLIVLTNEATGSAAEILAGALKDNQEATLIGKRTFGKGVGQLVIENDMPASSILKVTNFRFFTPSGEWIGDGHDNRKGISPHIEVDNPPSAKFGSAEDAQLNAALKHMDELVKKANDAHGDKR